MRWPVATLLICVLLLPVTVTVWAESGGEGGSTATFEDWPAAPLGYDVSFLWFDRLAKGSFSFAPGERPGTWRAVLEARTLGVAAWLTRDRVQRYETLMEQLPDGVYRSLFHQSQMIKGKGSKRKDRSKRFYFDHTRRQVRYQRAKAGTFDKGTVLPMAKGDAPNDILTAFFNLRAGVFGPFKPGARYQIPTFNRKGARVIDVKILTFEERGADPFFPPGGYLVRIDLDPEIFDTGDGSVYIWFDDQLLPARGIVENVIGLGNVKGTMRR